MKQEENYKISFAENSRRGRQIIAQQPVITYEQALAQIQMLKQASIIDHKLKKSGISA
jgi:uncharacterized protein YfeS